MAGNIKEYESPVDKITPSETGAEALARTGRIEKENIDETGRIYGGIIKTAGKAGDDYEYQQELSQGSAALAVMHNNMITAWNTKTAATDLNDTTIQQSFMDHTKDQLSDWEDGFNTQGGQDWARKASDQLYNQLDQKTAADMGIRAGQAAISNIKTTLINLSDTAGKDFTSMDHSLDQVDSMIAAQKQASTLDPKQLDTISADMKNEIVKSGLKGLADKNPAAAQQLLTRGDFSSYIDADEQKQLTQYAQVQQHAQTVNAQRQTQAEQYAKQQRNAQVNAQYISDVSQGKMPSATQIVSDKDLTPQQKTAWVAKGGILSLPESQLRSPLYGNGFSSGSAQIYGGKPPSDDAILDGVRQGSITPSGAAQLQKLAAMSKTPEGIAELNAQKPVLRDAQNQIVKGALGTNDPKGQGLYNRYLQTFYQAWDANIKKGITPAQMADPKDGNYIGNLAQQFKRSDAQALYDLTRPAAQ